jgi:hypothetical protein
MYSVILVHLGSSVPHYAPDSIKQLRLWNTPEELRIYFVIERHNTDFWEKLAADYSVELVYTDTLEPTEHHQMFRMKYKGDKAFRNGYWQFVIERFFYMEEVMTKYSLKATILMEYDVLVYLPFSELVPRLTEYTNQIALVRDNETRAHPGFMFVSSTMTELNEVIACTQENSYSDMELLDIYSKLYPTRVSYLPVINHRRNMTKFVRKSQDGHHGPIPSPLFLSSGHDILKCLFDSAVVGQWVGGIDGRNTADNGIFITESYENEGALYSMKEMPFEWKKIRGLWVPYLDNEPLATIHVHSKALECFLSDRVSTPKADYDVKKLYKALGV